MSRVTDRDTLWPMPRPLAAVITLGCKLNTADSEEIARSLHQVGFDVVDSVCEADAFVINTCSVTHVADAKSRKLIRSVRRLAPHAAVTVTGCFAQAAGAQAIRSLGVDYVAGTRDSDKVALIEFLLPYAKAPTAPGRELRTPIRGPARAFVKAQEGCNDVCSFCIVPRTRGREESRTIDRVAAEVQQAVDAGAWEVVVTGTQLGAWGRDLLIPMKPHHLISGILERTEVARLRFSSLQPQDMTSELLALWGDPRLMPHFHLALQSGSELTLAAMRRRYTAREFLLAVDRIRAAVPAAAVTTDVIAGFPGESAADFGATIDLCREARFAQMHCFPYSQRSRTSAALMPGHLPPETKKERMRRLLELNGELAAAFRRECEGLVRPVLWESERVFAKEPPLAFGYTDNYIPVYAAAGRTNRIAPVRLGGVYHDGVRGSIPGEAV